MRREEVVISEIGVLTLPDIPQPVDSGIEAMPLSELDLSVRSAKCMTMLGLETVGELLKHSEEELMGAKNFGATSMHEIQQRLATLGLSLKK